MTPFKAFAYYHGLHLHFTSEKYSILKYGAETKAAETKWKLMTQPQKFRFQWVSNKFQTTQDLVYAVIGAELNDLDCKFCDKQLVIDNYHKYKSRRESMTYSLNDEFAKYTIKNEFKFHQLIFNYLANIYSPEFVLLLDHPHNNLEKILNDSAFSFARPKILKLIKYKNFFSPIKYLHIIHHEESISA